MNIITDILGSIMSFSYNLFSNYWIAILIFTIITKFILIPVSIWVHKNSIKIIKMQPEINRIKARYFGDGERIAEEQHLIFKREKYNPFANLIPLFIQIFLLIGVINVMYNPLTHILNIPEYEVHELAKETIEITETDPDSPSLEVVIVNAVQNEEYKDRFLTISSIENINYIVNRIEEVNTDFLIFDLSDIPINSLGLTLLIPLLAGFSAWLLCFIQNKKNVLQAEQSKFNQYFTLSISVGLSLYLGTFVPAGVALYWIIGNLVAILQLYILNAIIRPSDFVDYKELEESRIELESLNRIAKKKNSMFKKDEYSKREKLDYKKFFSIENKKLVFYSEKSGFYKYFENTIDELLNISNITIHYITSDPNDQIFEISKKETRIKPYYIGERKLITLMMKMDANTVVMTMSDLQNYHIKRSIVKPDVNYVYMFHYPLSTHMVLGKGALDHYDTIFCIGEFQYPEIRNWEKLNNLKEKELISVGYGVLEKMDVNFKNFKKKDKNRTLLIAPSWQEDNILDSCIDEILDNVLKTDYKIIVRPHPEYVKRYESRMNKLIDRYKTVNTDKLKFELDFSSSDSLFGADVLISDWSGVAYEYAFITKRPALFVNTPMKVHNEDYEKIEIIPLEISLRDKIGISLETSNIKDINDSISKLEKNKNMYKKDIEKIFKDTISNFGDSGSIAANEILKQITRKK